MIDGYIVETGLGFLISIDYDKLSDIIKARKIKREERRRVKQEQEQNKTEQTNEVKQNP
jgi:hypothetical protein